MQRAELEVIMNGTRETMTRNRGGKLDGRRMSEGRRLSRPTEGPKDQQRSADALVAGLVGDAVFTLAVLSDTLAWLRGDCAGCYLRPWPVCNVRRPVRRHGV